jgi:hypothetical protein
MPPTVAREARDRRDLDRLDFRLVPLVFPHLRTIKALMSKNSFSAACQVHSEIPKELKQIGRKGNLTVPHRKLTA